ncbi:MAG: T9SS type A sorting domain-containing protein, partial [bacterium]|nr:T9SS type A sorting domain-containing protein [bacterium]
ESGGWFNTGEDFNTETASAGDIQPSCFSLYPCRPNPFNPTTILSFELRVASLVNLSIYDLSGRKVSELVSGRRESGSYQATFDGSNLPSGIYFTRLTAGEYSAVQKLVLLK